MSQGIVSQQTQEVDNAETAAAVAIDDRESAVKKLANAQRALEDAKGKQQHSLQVTASPSALPEVMPVIAESQISACRCLGALCMPQYCLHMFSLPPDNPSIKTLSFARTYTDNKTPINCVKSPCCSCTTFCMYCCCQIGDSSSPASILLILERSLLFRGFWKVQGLYCSPSFLDQRCSDWSISAPVHIATACSGVADKGGAFQS